MNKFQRFLVSSSLIFGFFLLSPSTVKAVFTPFQGGTGTTTTPSFGQVLMGLGGGIYGPVSTSTLGLVGQPASPNYGIQINNNGVFGASSGLTYNLSTNVLTLTHSEFSSALVINGHGDGGFTDYGLIVGYDSVSGNKLFSLSADSSQGNYGMLNLFGNSEEGGGRVFEFDSIDTALPTSDKRVLTQSVDYVNGEYQMNYILKTPSGGWTEPFIITPTTVTLGHLGHYNVGVNIINPEAELHIYGDGLQGYEAYVYGDDYNQITSLTINSNNTGTTEFFLKIVTGEGAGLYFYTDVERGNNLVGYAEPGENPITIIDTTGSATGITGVVNMDLTEDTSSIIVESQSNPVLLVDNGNTYLNGHLAVGIIPSYAITPNYLMEVVGSVDDFADFTVANISNTPCASADITPNNASSTNYDYYADFGITSAVFNCSDPDSALLGMMNYPNMTYLGGAGGPLTLFTASTTAPNYMSFLVGSGFYNTSSSEKMRLTDFGLEIGTTTASSSLTVNGLTNLNGTTSVSIICLGEDSCRSTWPTGGGGDSSWTAEGGFIYNSTSTDNVVIGTTNDSYSGAKLYVYNSNPSVASSSLKGWFEDGDSTNTLTNFKLSNMPLESSTTFFYDFDAENNHGIIYYIDGSEEHYNVGEFYSDGQGTYSVTGLNDLNVSGFVTVIGASNTSGTILRPVYESNDENEQITNYSLEQFRSYMTDNNLGSTIYAKINTNYNDGTYLLFYSDSSRTNLIAYSQLSPESDSLINSALENDITGYVHTGDLSFSDDNDIVLKMEGNAAGQPPTFLSEGGESIFKGNNSQNIVTFKDSNDVIGASITNSGVLSLSNDLDLSQSSKITIDGGNANGGKPQFAYGGGYFTFSMGQTGYWGTGNSTQFGWSDGAGGNGSRSGFYTYDYSNGGSFCVGCALSYGQYNGGIIRVSGTGVGIWDSSSAYLKIEGGKSIFAGNIGIGTTTPAVELDINGSIRAQIQSTTTSACTATLAGKIIYSRTDNHFYGCKSAGWAVLDN